MKGLFCLVFLLFSIGQCYGVLYRLNASQHDRLPKMYRFDTYDPCVREDNGLYCSVELQLVSDQPSEYLDFIRNYSEHKTTHFDYSHLQYSLCVTKSCRSFINSTTDLKSEANIRQIIEACMNDTIWKEYQLKSRISEKMACNTLEDHTIVIGIGEIVVAIVLFTIAGLNGVGTFYEMYCDKKEIKHRNRLLMCFSIITNWKKLVAPAGDGPDFRLKRLKGLNGIKSWSTLFVILAHGSVPFVIAIDNTFDFEENYHNLLYHIVFNGTLIVQTFFVMSGLLLSLNFLIYREKKNVSLKDFPRAIILRYARLTPAYALVLAVMSTWFQFAGTGPLWKKYAMLEVNDCKEYWYMNLLYANNFLDKKQCMPHTWYLAADMQLYIFGVLFCILASTKHAQKIGLSVMFTLGLIIPGVITYVKDLDATLIVSPDTALNVFVFDDTFNEIYKRGYTNLASYSIGLAFGIFLFHYLTNEFEETHKKFHKKRYITWLTFLLMFCVLFFGSLHYADGPRFHIAFRVFCAIVVKPFFAFLASSVIASIIFKGEWLFRGVSEWRGFTATARISYCAFLIHVMIIRGYAGAMTGMLHVSAFNITILFFGILMLTYLNAVPLFILVESPFGQLVKVLTTPAPRKESNFEKNVMPKNGDLVVELAEEKNKPATDSEHL